MANVAKLKKRALDFEQKKQFDKALEVYEQILERLDEHVDEADMALYNRVGDLLLRRGDTGAAVDRYEKAVDLYTDGGFFNNAIALCNKVLRNAPGRVSVYYKLGKISAKKGFINDAKQNFLEYADRMQQVGDFEEAFRALKEFADLCPDQDDIRLMLADQLARRDRKDEAVEQLQRLHDKLQSEGRAREARATVDRMKAIDPDVEPRASASVPTQRSSDLIFIDVNYDDGPAPVPGRPDAAATEPPVRRAPPPEPEPNLPPDDIELPLLDTGGADDVAADAPPRPQAMDDLITLDAANEDASEQDRDGVVVQPVDGLITGFDPPMLDGDAGPDTADAASSIPPITLMDDVVDADSSSGEGVDDEPGLAIAADGAESLASDVDVGDDLALIDVPPIAVDPSSAGDDDTLTFIHPEEALLSLGGGADVDSGSTAHTPTPSIAWTDDTAAGATASRRDAPDAVDTTGDEPAAAQVPEPEPVLGTTDRLRAAIAKAPGDWHLRRQLAEALFEEGHRAEGLDELEAVMAGLERANDLAGASSMVDEIIRVEPNSIRHHQKRVEYAVRVNDRTRMVDAYVDLAEALFRAGELDKSRVVYGRVLELAPRDERIRSALQALGRDSATPNGTAPVEPRPAAGVRRPGTAGTGGAPTPRPTPPVSRPVPIPAATPATQPAAEGDDFVNLADWLTEETAPKSTRMVVDVKEPAHDEQVDFAEMLAMFKQGVAANVDDADHESHYDLGVAYKEMGLLDEAIAEFQKALRGAEHRVRAYEALGQCFVEKEQYQIAVAILMRALGDKHSTDDMLVGVLYLLGYASEMLQRWADAQRFYERVFAVDIDFRDVNERLTAVGTHQ